MTTTTKNTTLALLNGKTAQPVTAGQSNAFKVKLGEHYRIVKVSDGAEQLFDNVIAKRVGDDLSLNYVEGTQVTLENYYVDCKASVACDVTLPSTDGVGYTLRGDGAAGVTLSEGSSLVYAHGSKDALTSMAQGNDTLQAALAGFHGNAISYVPVTPFSLGSPMLLGGLGGALAAAAGGGGGGGATSAVSVASPNMVSGTLVGGPVISSNDLSVILYKADGVTQVGSSTHFSGTGTLSIDVGSYIGVVIAKVTNGGTGLDYIDEATGRALDLTANLMSVGVAQAGTVHININALTTIAALKLGAVYAGASTALITAALVLQTNTAVASVFGLSSIEAADIVTTVNVSGTANANYTPGALNAAEKYGAILAALSGVDDANSGNMQTTIDQLVHELTVTGSTGTLSQNGLTAVISGAYAAASTANGTATNSLTSVVSNLMMQTNTSVSIDSVAAGDVISANGQAIIFGGTVVVGATVGLSIGGSTHIAVVSGDTWSYTLSGADISAIGRGGKAIAATATLSDGSVASVMRSFIVLADVSTTSLATADAELVAYNAAKAVVTDDASAASTDSAAAASALSTATTVGTGTVVAATAAVAATQKWVDDAAKQSVHTALQCTAAAALKTAAVASDATGDDAAATTAVSDSATATTVASNNLNAANAALVLAQTAQNNLIAAEAAKDDAAASGLTAYNAAKAVVTADVSAASTDSAAAASALSTAATVGTATAATTLAAVAAAQKWVDDAAKQSVDTVLQSTAAAALKTAAVASAATGDDAAATTAVSDSATATTVAANNVIAASAALTAANLAQSNLAAAELAKDVIAAAKLTAYNAAKLLVIADVSVASSDSADAGTALITATTVGTATVVAATAAVAAAQKWVTDAAKQSADTAFQSTTATALKAAAVSSAAIGDDAAAMTAVSDSATATTVAANNVIAANATLTEALAALAYQNTPEAKTAASAAVLASYNGTAASVVSYISSFNIDQISSMTTIGRVADSTTASAALTVAQKLLNDANNAAFNATAEKTSALALLIAAAATTETTDDAAAALAVAQANTDMATVTFEVDAAQKSVASAKLILGIYQGNVFPYVTPADAIAATAINTGLSNGLVNTIILNSSNAEGAVAVADNYFTSKTAIQNLVVGYTASGAIALALGALYCASGITNVFLNSASGAIAGNDTGSTVDSTITVNTLSGAVAFTTGSTNDTININTLSGAIGVVGTTGNDVINAVSQSGAIGITLTSGNNVIHAASTQAAGAILIDVTSGNNDISASTFGGAITINMASGVEHLKASTLGGAINITQAGGTGAATIQANTGGSIGAIAINTANGDNVIDATTYGGAITVSAGDGNNTISASTGTGIIIITTGSGNDDITVGSGKNGAFINAGAGHNSITLLAHSTLADHIDAISADVTLVTGATIGMTLADVYKIGSTSFAALASTPETTVGGTTAVAVSETGVLSFTGVVTDTGATFANHVLDILKATPGQFAKVVSYDDGVNQWLFVATSATAGHYLELIGSHDVNFAGASIAAAAHTILIG